MTNQDKIKVIESPNKKNPEKQPEVRVKNMLPIKFKDRPRGRAYEVIHLKPKFGFLPEVIMIEKVPGKNNTMIIRAIMTPEAIKKENDIKKKLKLDTPEIILPGKK